VNGNIFPFLCKDDFLWLKDWVERFLFPTLPHLIFLMVHVLRMSLISVPHSSPNTASLYLAVGELLDESIATLIYSGLITAIFRVTLRRRHERKSSNSHTSSLVPSSVVQRVDNAMHWKNHSPVDSVVCFVDTCPLDSDLSSG